MAASVADYLAAWKKSHARGIKLPLGQFTAAERFFRYVLQGIALERRVRSDPNSPTMAGISNLTIAVQVLAALPGNRSVDNDEAECLANSYVALLRKFRDGSTTPDDAPTAQEMFDFLKELQHQGNLARHAAFASTSSPGR